MIFFSFLLVLPWPVVKVRYINWSNNTLTYIAIGYIYPILAGI